MQRGHRHRRPGLVESVRRAAPIFGLVILIMLNERLAPAQDLHFGGNSSVGLSLPLPVRLNANDQLDLVGFVGSPAGVTVAAFFDVLGGAPAAMTSRTTLLPPSAQVAIQRLLTGDFNGDGNTDVLLIGPGSCSTVTWCAAVSFGSGNGTFAPPATVISTLDAPLEVSVADFNGDGRDDLLAIGPEGGGNSSGVDIFLSASGTWPLVLHTPSPNGARFALGDFDGNGITDAAVIVPGGIRVIRGSPGVPVVSPVLALPPLVGSVRLSSNGADLDGDSIDDLLVFGLSTTPTFYILHGEALAPLSTSTPLGVASAPLPFTFLADPVLADIDQDGRCDILLPWNVACPFPPVSGCTSGSLVLMLIRNLGAAFGVASPLTWSPLPPYGLNAPDALHVADLDGDGDLDIITTAYGSVVPGTSDLVVLLANDAIVGSGCAGAGGVPGFVIGSAFAGNAGFHADLLGARPQAVAVIGLSLGRNAGTGCALFPSLAVQDLLLPDAYGNGIVVTDALGAATVALPIPPDPLLHAAHIFAQWAIIDAAGTLTVAPLTLAATAGRTITIN